MSVFRNLLDNAVFYARSARSWLHAGDSHERVLAAVGAMLTRQVIAHPIANLREAEFRIFSQWGDDGIIQWLVAQLPDIPESFIEFGVEDYSESNTRFLLINNNWRGLVMDGSRARMESLRRRPWFWRHDLTAMHLFVDAQNIDPVISHWASGDSVGLLHIDLDGNDYWVWEAIRCISPPIAIMEYNAAFGPDRAITIPYRPDFMRLRAHSSGQYFGASLKAMVHLAHRKGYALIGVNSAGNNAYFVARQMVGGQVREVEVADVFVQPKFREARGADGRLSFAPTSSVFEQLRGMPVINVINGTTEVL